jgi:hypothetical protein
MATATSPAQVQCTAYLAAYQARRYSNNSYCTANAHQSCTGIEYSIRYLAAFLDPHQRPKLPIPHRYIIGIKSKKHLSKYNGTYHVSALCGSNSELPFRDWDLLGDVALHATALRKLEMPIAFNFLKYLTPVEVRI